MRYLSKSTFPMYIIFKGIKILQWFEGDFHWKFLEVHSPFFFDSHWVRDSPLYHVRIFIISFIWDRWSRARLPMWWFVRRYVSNSPPIAVAVRAAGDSASHPHFSSWWFFVFGPLPLGTGQCSTMWPGKLRVSLGLCRHACGRGHVGTQYHGWGKVQECPCVQWSEVPVTSPSVACGVQPLPV